VLPILEAGVDYVWRVDAERDGWHEGALWTFRAEDRRACAPYVQPAKHRIPAACASALDTLCGHKQGKGELICRTCLGKRSEKVRAAPALCTDDDFLAFCPHTCGPLVPRTTDQTRRTPSLAPARSTYTRASQTQWPCDAPEPAEPTEPTEPVEPAGPCATCDACLASGKCKRGRAFKSAEKCLAGGARWCGSLAPDESEGHLIKVPCGSCTTCKLKNGKCRPLSAAKCTQRSGRMCASFLEQGFLRKRAPGVVLLQAPGGQCPA